MSGSSATELPAPWLAPEALHGVERILISNVQGLDMRAATSGLVHGGQAPFLRQCTSVPTRHSLTRHGNMNPPMQVLRSSALLLWQEAPPLPLHKVQKLSIEELFKRHVLYFQVEREDVWADQMIMYWEPMNMKRDACVMAAKEAAAAAAAVDEAAASVAAAAAAKAARTAHFHAGGVHGSAAATAASAAAAKKARAAVKDAAGKQAVQDAAAATTAGLQGHCQRQTAPGCGHWSIVKSTTGTYIMTICWNNKPHDMDILILQGGGWHREVKGGDCPDMPFATAVSELVFTTWVEPKTKAMKKVAVKGPPRNPIRMSLSQATVRDAEEMGGDAPPTAVAGTNVRATALGAGNVPAEILARPKRARPTWTLLEPELADINAENFSLTPTEKYRLDIPTSVQAEGQGYVSTIDGRRAADVRDQEEGQVAAMDVDAATAAAVLSAATSPATAIAAAAAAAAEDAMDVAVAANSAADEAAAGAGGSANGDAPPAAAAAAAAAAASSASAAAAGAAAAAAVLADLSATEQTPFEQALTVAAKSADPFVCPSPALLIPSNGIWADGASHGYKLLGLDCEMVYTANGLELARATIVNARGVCLYDRYVLPSSPIINYNTEYSGVTAENMAGVTRTLQQCQADILQLIDAHTYIVGHSLDSDMRALRLVHNRLIDTSILYPTVKGAPFKQGLRTLCCAVLGRDVQVGSGTRYV
jgi:hypothetical protein